MKTGNTQLGGGTQKRIVRHDINGNPSADQAVGCVSCLGCLAFPEVWRTPGSRRYNTAARWTIRCKNCDGEWHTGLTREEAVASWNMANERLRIL